MSAGNQIQEQQMNTLNHEAISLAPATGPLEKNFADSNIHGLDNLDLDWKPSGKHQEMITRCSKEIWIVS